MTEDATTQDETVATPAKRNNRKTEVGVVVSDKMNKTIVVRLERHLRHPLYGKILRRWTKYKAHDENNEAHAGDTVEIMQTRPLSKGKRWRLVRVIQRVAE